MQAIRVHEFGPAEVMRLEEVPDPAAGPGEVLVRILAAGVNPVDTYIRSGQYASKPALPYTPGSDAGGVIEALGEGVVGVAVGDRVYVGGSKTGTYAQKAVCGADQVHAIPDSLTFAQAAAMNVPYATAFRALVQRAKAVEGETVLVHGATGGVGVASVQIARSRGMTVIGTGGSEEGRQMILKQGAHHALDHHAPDYLQQVSALTGGRGVDVVLEMAAHLNLGKVLSAVAPAGRVVVIGSRGPVEINPRDLMARDAAVMGMVLFLTPQKELAGVHAALVAGLEAGFLQPVIDSELALAEAPEAHRRVMEGRSHGKIALIP